MVELEPIDGFEWDEGNRWKSTAKHDVTPAEAEQVFLGDPPLIAEDVRHSASEPRFHALGRTDSGRSLHVTFTLRHGGTKIRVTSARDMHRQEKARYGQEAKASPEIQE